MTRITLDELKPAEGATHREKRKGRGRSSGMGKTSCRGHNGEGQRSGRSRKRGFEGGQMPGYRKVPKLKGFQLVGQLKTAELKVCDIEKLNIDVIDLEVLKEMGKAHPSSDVLRVLGNGEIKKAVTVKARHFTASAKEKIEAAGGKVEVK